MKYLPRTHGTNIQFLYDHLGKHNNKINVDIVKTASKYMAADVHTKGFVNPEDWLHVCSLINMCYPKDFAKRIKEHHDTFSLEGKVDKVEGDESTIVHYDANDFLSDAASGSSAFCQESSIATVAQVKHPLRRCRACIAMAPKKEALPGERTPTAPAICSRPGASSGAGPKAKAEAKRPNVHLFDQMYDRVAEQFPATEPRPRVKLGQDGHRLRVKSGQDSLRRTRSIQTRRGEDQRAVRVVQLVAMRVVCLYAMHTSVQWQ